MFRFLKEKLKKATSLFSRRIAEEAGEQGAGERGAASIQQPEPGTAQAEGVKEKYPAGQKKGILHKAAEKITKKTISGQKFDELFWDLEVTLMENNVAVEVVDKIKEDLKKSIVDVPISRGSVLKTINESLRESIEGLFLTGPVDIVQKVKEKKPFVILFLGVNGSGKTTTIAKMARLLQKNGQACAIAAADTFRAASIEQLQKHADALKVRLIRHNYGSDPAAVAFDAVRHAEAHGLDAVLIDTAGRQHSNVNLMDELKKIARIAKPDLKIFVGEAITGNDCVEQARKFNEAIGIDGIVLAKADIDEKGGAAVSVSYITRKPILYLGTGQGYEDLEKFDSEKIMKSIGLEA